MIETANGGPSGAAAKPAANSSDIPPHEQIARLLSSDDETDVTGAVATPR